MLLFACIFYQKFIGTLNANAAEYLDGGAFVELHFTAAVGVGLSYNTFLCKIQMHLSWTMVMDARTTLQSPMGSKLSFLSFLVEF
jgi:hypothetical protein